MINPDTFSISDYLNKTFSCNCGRDHTTAIKDIDISQGAIHRIPGHMERFGYKKAFLISDYNTHKVAGKKLYEILNQKGIPTIDFVFQDPLVVPDEKTIGELLVAFKDDCDVIIAVGSGTINDIGKYMSHKLGKEYFVVATAPSMDGFASTGAALIINNLKTTYNTHSPQMIIADIDIISQAPMNMITAGLGDILGKYTCLCDWKIANIINNEYYCEKVVEMVNVSIAKVVGSIDGLESRAPQAIYNITEALMLAGIAMSFVDNSRPASGSEHHISHYWEMKFLLEGKEAVLHGTKVGIGTVAILKLYEMLQDIKIDFEQARDVAKRFDITKWEKNIRRTFGEAAQGVIELEKVTKKNEAKGQLKRIDTIERKWNEMIKVLEKTLPKAEVVEAMLAQVGASMNPEQEGIGFDTMVDSIVVAKEVRDRYTLLQILWDLGISEEMGNKIGLYFKEGQKTQDYLHYL